MKKKTLFLLNTLVMLAVLLTPSVALAAKPATGGGSKPPTNTTEHIGYDVSYPQCGKSLPTDFYFGIVGVNGGTAAAANDCLADQLVWAYKAKVGSNQPRVQLYVNTANPGELISQISTWPTTSTDSNGDRPTNPYGACNGANDKACSWLYGWNRSIYTYGVFRDAANSKGLEGDPSQYVWWLDVETMNTWQTSRNKEAQIRNTAAIEGFGAYYQSKGGTIGLYSTGEQWTSITGNNVSATSNLRGLGNWRPSGSSLAIAKSNCSAAPLTAGGFISLTQYVVKGLDNNHSC